MLPTNRHLPWRCPSPCPSCLFGTRRWRASFFFLWTLSLLFCLVTIPSQVPQTSWILLPSTFVAVLTFSCSCDPLLVDRSSSCKPPDPFASLLSTGSRQDLLAAIHDWDQLSAAWITELISLACIGTNLRPAFPDCKISPSRWRHGRQWDELDNGGHPSQFAGTLRRCTCSADFSDQ